MKFHYLAKAERLGRRDDRNTRILFTSGLGRTVMLESAVRLSLGAHSFLVERPPATIECPGDGS